MIELVDEAGEVVALVEFDPPAVESDDPELRAWAEAGVPGLEGFVEDDVARERERTTAPDDPLWGLEVLNAAELRGWGYREAGQEPALEEAAGEGVQARLLVRKVEGTSFAPGSSWEDAGLHEIGPGAAGVQMAIEKAKGEGKTWITVDPHPRRYHGRCPECKKPVTSLVQERIQVGQRTGSYGHQLNVVTRNALPTDMQPGEGVDVSGEGVRLTCPRDGRKVMSSPIKGKFSLEIVCDARCMNAKGPSCECSCAGANHGAAWGI